MSGTALLKHSKLNCTVWWTMIARGLPNLIGIVCLKKSTSFDNNKIIFKMSGPQLLQLFKINWNMQWTIIASSLPIFMSIVSWKKYFNFFNAEILLKTPAKYC